MIDPDGQATGDPQPLCAIRETTSIAGSKCLQLTMDWLQCNN
jgi:hypothetical protein